MACLNCLECLTYIDNELSLRLDPDGYLTCDSDGVLTFDETVAPRIDSFVDCDDFDESCTNNGLNATCTGKLWMPPYPCVRWFSGESYQYLAQNIATNSLYTSPSINVTLPANDTCYAMRCKIAMYRSIRFDQQTALNFRVTDNIDGAESVIRNAYTMPGGSHFSEVGNNFMYCVNQPPNSGALQIPFSVNIRTGGTGTGNILYWVRHRFTVTCVSMVGCDNVI